MPETQFWENRMTTHPPEIRIVDGYKVACDGGGAAGGHPRVWLQIPEEHGWIECPYCDCRFVHKDHAEKPQHEPAS